LPHTAHAIRGGGEMGVAPTNLIVRRGTTSFEDLTRLSTETLVITNIDAIHSGVKSSTGDFSLPASGFLYRNGEKIAPIHQFVMSGNVIALLAKVSQISNRWNDNGESTRSPDFFVPEMSIAGQ